MKRLLIHLCILLAISYSSAQEKKTLKMEKTNIDHKIDGVVDDEDW